MQTLDIISIISLFIICGLNAESEHRTKAASEKVSDLYCYKCDTIMGDNNCLQIKDNRTLEKCEKDHRICQVKKITMFQQNEDQPTAEKKIWLLKRFCTRTCEPVCVTIGERIKLRACNTCCETSYCNTGNAALSLSIASIHRSLLIAALLLFAVLINQRQEALASVTFFDDERTRYQNKY